MFFRLWLLFFFVACLITAQLLPAWLYWCFAAILSLIHVLVIPIIVNILKVPLPSDMLKEIFGQAYQHDMDVAVGTVLSRTVLVERYKRRGYYFNHNMLKTYEINFQTVSLSDHRIKRFETTLIREEELKDGVYPLFKSDFFICIENGIGYFLYKDGTIISP